MQYRHLKIAINKEKKAEEALMKGDGKSVLAFCFLVYCSEEEQHNCYHIHSLGMEGIYSKTELYKQTLDLP